MDKLELRLSKNREQKFEEAKLADVGVTRDGLDLYNVIKKTLEVRWQESDLIILDDIKISPPYSQSSVEKLRPDAKDQSLEIVRKRLEKFYSERDQQEIAAALWELCVLNFSNLEIDEFMKLTSLWNWRIYKMNGSIYNEKWIDL